MPSYRVVVYDSPEHTVEYLVRVLVAALGVPEERARALADELETADAIRLPLPDRAAAEAAFDAIGRAGPDPAVRESSSGLAVALEAERHGSFSVIRRGRWVGDAFVAMDGAAVAAFPTSGGGDRSKRGTVGTELLRVRGPDDAFVRFVRVGSFACFFAALYTVVTAGIPELPQPVFFRVGSPGVRTLLGVLVIVGGVVLELVVQRVLRPRRGIVVFAEQKIRFLKPRGNDRLEGFIVAWSDVEAFDDGASDHVRLFCKGEVDASYTTVPTPTDATRAAVLELLAKRGIARRESG